jgi:hypothetical protein
MLIYYTNIQQKSTFIRARDKRSAQLFSIAKAGKIYAPWLISKRFLNIIFLSFYVNLAEANHLPGPRQPTNVLSETCALGSL